MLFPGIPLPLHIFEPRYRMMINECLAADAPFGVVLIRRGVEAGGPVAEPYPVGCSARILESETLPDGRISITAVGGERFRILALDHSRTYLQGEVEAYPLDETGLPHARAGADATLSRTVRRYLELLRAITGASFEYEDVLLPIEPLLLMYFSAAILQIPAPEKQPMLAAASAGSLLDMLNRVYSREIGVLSRTSKISPRAAEKLARLN